MNALPGALARERRDRSQTPPSLATGAFFLSSPALERPRGDRIDVAVRQAHEFAPVALEGDGAEHQGAPWAREPERALVLEQGLEPRAIRSDGAPATLD